jgi:hypothetical protein
METKPQKEDGFSASEFAEAEATKAKAKAEEVKEELERQIKEIRTLKITPQNKVEILAWSTKIVALHLRARAWKTQATAWKARAQFWATATALSNPEASSLKEDREEAIQAWIIYRHWDKTATNAEDLAEFPGV